MPPLLPDLTPLPRDLGSHVLDFGPDGTEIWQAHPGSMGKLKREQKKNTTSNRLLGIAFLGFVDPNLGTVSYSVYLYTIQRA